MLLTSGVSPTRTDAITWLEIYLYGNERSEAAPSPAESFYPITVTTGKYAESTVDVQHVHKHTGVNIQCIQESFFFPNICIKQAAGKEF